MRVMALDVGERRIGVALSDPLGSFAQPHATVAVAGRRRDVERLAAIAREHQVEEVVVGLPLHLDGGEGEAARRARRLGGALAAALGCRVTYWDERLTTVQAERALLEGGVRRRRRKGVVDQVAAALILQAYLDSRAPEGLDDPEPRLP
ncbi:MAG: Holliday junction resolvase RuvX [Nitrospirae bacterium]|nr:MAG: Holliday junction resolvase RuvX [Nitrospirota bacterium]